MSEAPQFQIIEEAGAFLRRRGISSCDLACILGSGFSGVLSLPSSVNVPFAEIPGFPSGALAGHERVLSWGAIDGANLLVFRGRYHAYEGIPLAQAVLPVRVARNLGAKTLILVSASGALSPSYEVGDLVFLTDHVNFMGDNPLIGANDDRLGPRFPDMSRTYTPELILRAEGAAKKLGIQTRRGVYAAVPGPHYETPAEIRMLQRAGADLIGMSTVPEAICGVHSGLQILGISVVTDLAFPEVPEPITHQRVVEAGRLAAPRVDALLREFLRGWKP